MHRQSTGTAGQDRHGNQVLVRSSRHHQGEQPPVGALYQRQPRRPVPGRAIIHRQYRTRLKADVICSASCAARMVVDCSCSNPSHILVQWANLGHSKVQRRRRRCGMRCTKRGSAPQIAQYRSATCLCSCTRRPFMGPLPPGDSRAERACGTAQLERITQEPLMLFRFAQRECDALAIQDYRRAHQAHCCVLYSLCPSTATAERHQIALARPGAVPCACPLKQPSCVSSARPNRYWNIQEK